MDLFAEFGFEMEKHEEQGTVLNPQKLLAGLQSERKESRILSDGMPMNFYNRNAETIPGKE